MSKKEYFAYGSNLNFEQMAYRCPEATVVGAAKLDGYELAFRRGYLTILPKEGASVEGLIWSITDHDESQLDCYEGYPTFYDKETMTVTDADGAPHEIMVYTMNEPYRDQLLPVSSRYNAVVSWMLIEVFSEGKTTLVGASTGLVIGLVAITPGAGFVPMWAAVICGLLVSPICYFSVKLIKGKLKIDDALDAFGCHGIGGIWGGIATGLFGMTSINGVAKWNGLVFGETRLFVAQIIGILVSIAVAVVGSLICIAIVRIFTPLRVEERAEKVGLDVSEHGENAYPSFNGLD